MKRVASVAAVLAMVATAVGVGLVSPVAAQTGTGQGGAGQGGAGQGQTGYPPGQCTVINSVQNLGSFQVGGSFNQTVTPICAFGPVSVSVTVNNVEIGSRPAAGGGVPIIINILSATQLSVGGVNVPAVCGVNTIVLTGHSDAAGGQVTHTVTFEVICPPAAAVAQPRPRVAFTGGNILRWSAIALVLVGLGALFVTSARRRRDRTNELVG